MKNLVIGATAMFALIALLFSFNSFYRIRSQACQQARDRCVQECDRVRDRGLGENQLRRTQINFELLQELRECLINNVGNQQAINQCQTEKTNAAQLELAHLDASDTAIRAARLECVTECDNEAKKCDKNSGLPGINVPVGVNRPTIVDCLEGGPPCFKPVLEICKLIEGPCDECWKTLCGGGDWSFESSVPLEVTLVAAINPLKNARTLATSSIRGKQAVLNVPTDIKLNPSEQLYFGFSSKEKPGGPVKVIIQRNK